MQRDDVVAEILEVERLQPRRVDLDDDEAHAEPVEDARQPQPGVAAAEHEQEGLGDAAHAPFEADRRDRALEGAVLHGREQRQQHVGPRDDRQVDDDGGPHALRIGERDGNFAEADRRRRVGDEIEGVEEAQRRGRPPVGIDAGNEHEARHRDREHDDDDEQRKPQQVQHARMRKPGEAGRCRGRCQVDSGHVVRGGVGRG